MISAEALLKPISDAQPCGDDLSSDAGLLELEELMKGKPETQFSAAEEPEWRTLHQRCVDLAGRSKDLRVLTKLCLSALKTEGLPGLKEAAVGLSGVVEQYWEAIYPRLDPQDNNDPMERANILSSLATPVGTFGDPMKFLERLRSVPLADSPQMGRFTLADIGVSQGKSPPPQGKTAPTTAQIEAAFRGTKPEYLAAVYAASVETLAAIKRMDEFLGKTIGVGSAPNLENLRNGLVEVQKALAPYVPGAGQVAEPGGEAQPDGSPASSASARSAPGEITSPQDVIQAIDRICHYYDRYERSSPVPHLLKRAKRLAGMSFMEITSDLSPDALAQLRTIFGEKDESASG